MMMKRLFATVGFCALASLAATSSIAAPTTYPLTIENCGATVTFNKAPERAVALGQNSAEIMLLLGLQDKMVGTAFWPNKVLPQVAEANAKVKVLTVEFPTFESILAQNPDFVTAALPTLVGPTSKVAKREDFDKLGISTYLSPSMCALDDVPRTSPVTAIARSCGTWTLFTRKSTTSRRFSTWQTKARPLLQI